MSNPFFISDSQVVGQPHLDGSSEEQVIVANPPDVCQVVEVTTESDEQPLSMSQLYPLQISPVSSYAGKCSGIALHSFSGNVWKMLGGSGLFQSSWQWSRNGCSTVICFFNEAQTLTVFYSFHLGKQLCRSEVENVSCGF